MRAVGGLDACMTRVGCEGNAHATESGRARWARHGLFIPYIIPIQLDNDDFASLRRRGPTVWELHEGVYFSVHDAQVSISLDAIAVVVAHTVGFHAR